MTDLKKPTFAELYRNMEDFPSYHSELTSDAIKKLVLDITLKKNELIKTKLEAAGLGHLLNDIEQRRFKRIAIEYRPTEEVYWADDGTIEGFRIITFKNEEPKCSFDNEIHKMGMELKYY